VGLGVSIFYAEKVRKRKERLSQRTTTIIGTKLDSDGYSTGSNIEMIPRASF